MNKRFYYDEFLEEIYDSSIDDYPTNQTICGILNDQQQRIAELEEQLKNAIVPKFKIGQEAFFVYKGDIIESYNISKMSLMCFDDNGEWLKEDELFATKEEAEQKLKQLKERVGYGTSKEKRL